MRHPGKGDDPIGDQVRVLSAAGEELAAWSVPFTPQAIAVGADGEVYVGGGGPEGQPQTVTMRLEGANRDLAGALLHRWFDGRAGVAAMLDDYAMLADGLVDLYQATFEPGWLRWAVELVDELVESLETGQGTLGDLEHQVDALGLVLHLAPP